jgi:type I restriction enzyme R subunit
VDHFKLRQEVFPEGKAMAVSMSRRIAAELYREIINIRPTWHNDESKEGVLILVTSRQPNRSIKHMFYGR